MFTVYILFSKQLNMFYCGYTGTSIAKRLQQHLYDHKGFTSKAKDWEIIYSKIEINKTDAIKLEKKIKKRGIKRFLNDIASR